MDSRELLAKLIAFDTTSAKSNLALIEFVEEYLQQHGVSSQRVYDEAQGKANLYATIGPQDRGGVMLSGHTDVVPTAGQAWSSDPYTLRQADGKLYGRGACDMKGFIASVLAAVPLLQSRPLHTPVHLAFSYDEEVGCLGVRRLAQMMQDLPHLPAMAIIGEPTSMTPMIGHKGKRAFRVQVAGHSCHSAYPVEGVNAIEYAAELITWLRREQRRIRDNGPFDADYRVPYSTIHVGVIEGGNALNIVPQNCSFDFEIRHLPQDDPDPLLARLQIFIDDELLVQMRADGHPAEISLTPLSAYPGLLTPPDTEVVQFVAELLQGNAPPSKVSFGTEAGVFQQRLGIPAVVCGPGSILQAHKPDEYVSEEQLDRCDQLMRRLAQRLAAADA